MSRGLALACLMACFYAMPASAEIITPRGVAATSEFGLGVIEASNLIDGSGLNEEGLHDNVDAGMWFSGCADAGIPGGTPAECPTGFEVAPVNEQIVEFQLDSAYTLTSAHIWQYNELNAGVGPLPERGVSRFELLVSQGTAAPFVSLGEYELGLSSPSETPGEATEPAQVFDIAGLPGTERVRRVRINILAAHSGNEVDYVGLSEVRFEGALAPASLPVDTPPALIIMALLSLAAGSFVLWRRYSQLLA